jgi:hypothetical protein
VAEATARKRIAKTRIVIDSDTSLRGKQGTSIYLLGKQL